MRDYRVYLKDILEAIERIEEYTGGMDFEKRFLRTTKERRFYSEDIKSSEYPPKGEGRELKRVSRTIGAGPSLKTTKPKVKVDRPLGSVKLNMFPWGTAWWMVKRVAELSAEEKRRIIEALERDKEFRYSLMGLLGYREVLERITGLEKRFADLEERFARLEERQQRIEERFAELEERFAKLEERQQRLEERQQRLEERFADLEERFADLEERFEKGMAETRRLLTAIAHRFGIITEESFREGMRYVVEDVFGVAEVSKWRHYDEEGIVYGHPAIIEADILIKDREHILMEIKSRVDRGDISELHRIGSLYEKVTGVKPKLTIIGAFIDEKAQELAKTLDIEIRPVTRE